MTTAISAAAPSEQVRVVLEAPPVLIASTLGQIYEDHAEDCIRTAATMTDDPKHRDVLINLAIKWREAAEALRREPLQWPLKPLRMAQIYEDHAEDCIRTAARTNDAKHRDALLNLAVQWRARAH
jgi:DNA-binding FrmR family transcriptional regulator